MSTATAEAAQAQGTTPRAGLVLDGKYRIEYLLGQGGMAAVWAGTNERTGKRVALKVLLPSVSATAGADALFQREALTASRINHPNVVTVFDVVTHQGMACIVMELLTGETFDVYLARAGKLSMGEAYGLLLPAMRGVSAAHAQGVIHRDLKPQNIFICVGPDGRAVTSKVLDFGISLVRAVDSPLAGAPLPMGTPAYMAPEQVAGEAIDERADVYGFGVLLFEALTGEVPFRGSPGVELYKRILFEQPPLVSELRPDVPAPIVRAIATALAKEREARHASLDAMIAALEAELMPATPLPGAHPAVDAHLLAAADPASPGATPHPPGERAGEHQPTQFLVSFPLSAPRAPASVDETRTISVVGARAQFRRVFASRVGRSIAGIAIGVLAAGGGYLGWSWMGGRVRAAAQPPRVVVQPSTSVPQTVTPLVEPMRPPRESPATRAAPPPEPFAVAPPALLVAGPAPPVTPTVVVSPTRTSASVGKPVRPRHARAVSKVAALALQSGSPSPAPPRAEPPPARTMPSAARAPSSPPKAPGKPRAGRLSPDDF